MFFFFVVFFCYIELRQCLKNWLLCKNQFGVQGKSPQEVLPGIVCLSGALGSLEQLK